MAFINDAHYFIFPVGVSVLPKVNAVNDPHGAPRALKNLGSMIFRELGARTTTEKNRGDKRVESIRIFWLSGAILSIVATEQS